MSKLQETIIGILMFVFGIIATYYTWDMVVVFYGIIDSTLLRIIWIVGLFAVWITNIIIVPYLLFVGKSGIKLKNAIKGLIIFIVASFASYLSYFIIPPIIETLDAITGFGDMEIVGSMIWFGLILFWVLSMVAYPIAVILQGGILKNDNE